MRVCYFGTYEQDYVRNRTIVDGLRKYGWEVEECHVPLWERQRDKTGSYLQVVSLIKRAIEVLTAYIRLILKYLFSVRRYDVLMVGYIGHLDMPLAWLLSRIPRRPLVFNPLISLYDTLVDDRAGLCQRVAHERISTTTGSMDLPRRRSGAARHGRTHHLLRRHIRSAA